MAFTGPMEDRLLIRELYSVYSDATFRADREAHLSCWHENGVRIARDGECRGKAAIAAYWDQVWQMIDSMAFFTEIAAIEVDGDRATARAYCREIIKLKDGALWKVVGRYEDELVRDNGAWLFSSKSYTLLMNEPKIAPSAA